MPNSKSQAPIVAVSEALKIRALEESTCPTCQKLVLKGALCIWVEDDRGEASILHSECFLAGPFVIEKVS